MVVRLFVATWAEAVALAGFRPVVTGMGRRGYDFAGCEAVVSAGFAGACRPGQRPGDVLFSDRADIRSIDHIASPEEKRALGGEAADAVDMETAWVCAAAVEAGLPFIGVRVIIDRLDDRAFSVATAWHYPAAAMALRRAVTNLLATWPDERAGSLTPALSPGGGRGSSEIISTLSSSGGASSEAVDS